MSQNNTHPNVELTATDYMVPNPHVEFNKHERDIPTQQRALMLSLRAVLEIHKQLQFAKAHIANSAITLHSSLPTMSILLASKFFVSPTLTDLSTEIVRATNLNFEDCVTHLSTHLAKQILQLPVNVGDKEEVNASLIAAQAYFNKSPPTKPNSPIMIPNPTILSDQSNKENIPPEGTIAVLRNILKAINEEDKNEPPLKPATLVPTCTPVKVSNSNMGEEIHNLLEFMKREDQRALPCHFIPPRGFTTWIANGESNPMYWVSILDALLEAKGIAADYGGKKFRIAQIGLIHAPHFIGKKPAGMHTGNYYIAATKKALTAKLAE